MTPAEVNYNIYNKELLGIVTVLKEWRAVLYSIIEANLSNYITLI